MQLQLNPIKFKWLLKETVVKENRSIDVPVYLNNSRDIVLFSVSMKIPDDDTPSYIWYQRGTAIVSNKI